MSFWSYGPRPSSQMQETEVKLLLEVQNGRSEGMWDPQLVFGSLSLYSDISSRRSSEADVWWEVCLVAGSAVQEMLAANGRLPTASICSPTPQRGERKRGTEFTGAQPESGAHRRAVPYYTAPPPQVDFREMDDIDAMFSDLLGEMDLLTQSNMFLKLYTPLMQRFLNTTHLLQTGSFSHIIPEMDVSTLATDDKVTKTLHRSPRRSRLDVTTVTAGSTAMKEPPSVRSQSLNELEDTDLDALMADLMADLNATEEKLAAQIEDLKEPSPPPPNLQPPPGGLSVRPVSTLASPTSQASSGVSASSSAATSPLPPPQAAKPTKEEIEAQMKADKIKLALEKLKEAKVKKACTTMQTSTIHETEGGREEGAGLISRAMAGGIARPDQ
ncbi:Amyloid beta A4 precursor protein-binding family B member 1-interacting protein [Liparis tanakae]|uniref:Amyloid beta A4 protein-binding family B member 1-interacting protein n=1 Tax=Liparis tanakae TaxID=230148 RepID=A0A4Z2GWN9_9TELE|nr:Amyloid beta A4 precursor protein-binding family B member 1-interacting protein [Liparis tanakae]